MRTLAPRLALAALALTAVTGSALAARPAPKPEAVNAVFLTTFAPVQGALGVKYGARLTCGPLEGECIAGGSMTFTLTDTAGTVVDTQTVEYSGEAAAATWRAVVTARGVSGATYCGYASATYTLADGTSQTLTSSEPVCATGE